MSFRCGFLILLSVVLMGGIVRSGAAQSMAPVYNPANGHWYQAVPVAGAISWDDARKAAESLSYVGFPGHLVTVTSAAETQFLTNNVLRPAPNNDRWWLGGYQDGSAPDYIEPAGGWRWVTGEPWSYTNWLPGQPDNYGGNEDAIEFHTGPTWNDFPRSSGLSGYVVEYEPVPIATGPLLSFSPNQVAGGLTTTGQIILAQPAGLGGAVVSLSSSNPAAAAVPAVVTIPTGANTFSFSVTTFAVGAITPVTISVASPSGTASATLQVVPASTPSLPPGQQPIGAPVYNPANGHWYQAIVTTAGVNWYQAEGFAAALIYAGYAGHLATITSDAEQQFVASHLPVSDQQYWWIGAYQDKTAPDYREPAGGWRWITGEPFGPYTHWYPGQPDNDSNIWSNGENALEFDAKLGNWWNDFPEAIPIHGYLVEYEPPASVPPPQPSGMPVYNPANGHWYQLVRVPGQINWPDARSAAQARVFAGYPGHLATITTADEQQFINSNITGGSGLDIVWLGGYQDSTAPDYREPDGGWRWVTGEPFQYTNWHPGEPNDSPHDSNALELAVVWGGQWDDRLANQAFLPGYVVEFEPAPGVAPAPTPVPANSSQLVLFPNPALSGQPALGQITLTQPAGAGGLVVTLTSNNPAAVVPATVTVPAGASSATFVITTLPVGAPTAVTITAGCSFGTATAVLQLLPVAGSPARGPAAPTNFTAKMSINARVHLAWTDNSAGKTGFALWRKGGGTDWTWIAVLPANTTTFADAGIGPSTLYTYRVQAVSDAAVSDWSDGASVTTPAAPAAPSDFTIFVAGVDQINLSWSVNVNNSRAVEVYRKGSGADWTLIAVLAPNTVGYMDRRVQPGTSYTYRLRTANDFFASGWSNEAEATTRAGV